MCFEDASSCEAYLITLPQGTATVQRAKALAEAMLGCQPTDQAYHDWAADSVLDVRIQLEQCLQNASAPAKLASRGSGQARKTSLALESVLVSILHASVMDSLADAHAGADEALYTQTQEHHAAGCQVLNSSLAQLSGAGKGLVGMDLSGASAQLQRMDGECRCPLEMLRCVNEADRCLAESVGRLRQSAHSEEAVSADDLLSTTIAAIVVAQPQHLISSLEYLKLFHGTGDWSGKTGFQVATLEAAAAYLEQINPACSALSTPGAKPRHSQEFVRALLEDDEPLTFASSTRLHSSPMQIPSRHDGVSPDNLRYGHAVSLRQLIGEELMQRAASIQRAASLQREASLRRTASGALAIDPSQQAQDAKMVGYVQ